MTNETTTPAILIVDDEQSILNALKRVLREESYTIYAVNNCPEALELISTTKFAVVISDYTMPDMSGAELLAAVKANNPRTVRIMLSGATGSRSVPEAIADGILNCQKFIAKPWNDDELRQMLRQCVAEYDAACEKTIAI